MLEIKNTLNTHNKTNKFKKGYILLTTSIVIFVVASILSSLCAGFMFSSSLENSDLTISKEEEKNKVLNLSSSVHDFINSNYFDLFYIVKNNSKTKEVKIPEDNTSKTIVDFNISENSIEDFKLRFDYHFDENDANKFFDLSGVNEGVTPSFDYDKKHYVETNDKDGKPIYKEENITDSVNNLYLSTYFKDVEDIEIDLIFDQMEYPNASAIEVLDLDDESIRVYSKNKISQITILKDFDVVIKSNNYELILEYNITPKYNEVSDGSNKIEYPFEYMPQPIEEGDGENSTENQGEIGGDNLVEGEGETNNPDEGGEETNPGEGEEPKLYNQELKLTFSVKEKIEKLTK